MSLPQDVIIDILARVPRCNYRKLSLVSKHFRSLVTCPELYASRSLLGYNKHYIYAVLYNYATSDNHLYSLRWKANGNPSLFLISSLPAITIGGSFVAVGSKIYVFCEIGCTSMSIDCRSHIVQPLPGMPVPMANVAAVSINEKIYVVGYCHRYYSMNQVIVVTVFNTETQIWERRIIMPDVDPGSMWKYGRVVVMADKIYMRCSKNSFVFDPKESKLKTDEILNLKEWRNACVIDDVLYYYDCIIGGEKMLRAYDQKRRCWEVVKGVEALSAVTPSTPLLVSELVTLMSYGGKLALVFLRSDETWSTANWCAEISLERRHEGEIWGKVEWCNRLMPGKFVVKKFLDFMI